MKFAPELRKGAVSDKAMLKEMSLEVDRIARNLSKLLHDGEGADAEQDLGGIEKPQASVDRNDVRELIKARRARTKFFDADLFADPAWDILLHLFDAELGQYRLSVSGACSYTEVPQSTGLRWLNYLEQRGLVVRRPDPCDGRRIFLELSLVGSAKMTRFFQTIVRRERDDQA